jgi:DNA-binding NarL/FixJ family response regulator
MIASPSASRQEAIRAAVMTLPHVEVYACAADSRAVAAALAAGQPHVLVIDMMLPDSESLAVIRWVREFHPAVAILAVAFGARQSQLALAAGADGAVLQTSLVEQLAEAMARVIGRERPAAPPAIRRPGVRRPAE